MSDASDHRQRRTAATNIVGDRSRWRLLADVAMADDEGAAVWHANEASSQSVAYVAIHRLRGKGKSPIADEGALFVVGAGPWVFVKRIDPGEDVSTWPLPKQVIEWQQRNPSKGGRHGKWRNLANEARQTPGAWKSLNADTASAASAAATRLRGAGTAPLADVDEFDVRISEDGLSVFIQIPTSQEAPQ